MNVYERHVSNLICLNHGLLAEFKMCFVIAVYSSVCMFVCVLRLQIRLCKISLGGVLTA